MAGSAITALATLTLGSAQATVTFSSISGAYRDLRLVVSGQPVSGGNIRLGFNADSGSNFNQVNLLGDGFSATSTANASLAGSFALPNWTPGSTSDLYVDVLDYSATDKHKAILSRSNSNATPVVGALAGRWASTAAITSLAIFSAGGNMAAGSTFTLYGVSA